ncbi:DUF7674 family protein [Massilia eburnea]|uniref:DUF7674 family protein n=1 Tax=Massilia eburnea TaxID=1776165 RepID=UPI003D6B5193
MQTNSAFYLAARERFPALAQKADRKYLKYWNEQPLAAEPYSWFESAANALNDDMQREDSLVECSQFFEFVTNVFASASEEVRQCIDVSFVENLFWQVPPAKAAAYWSKLPPPLQTLYLGFHNKPPI